MAGSSGSYRLRPRSEADLEEIWLFSREQWSTEQADSYHRDIMAAIEGLAAGTKAGRSVDLREGYLKYPAGSHVIYFVPTESGIDVVRILHSRMDVNRHVLQPLQSGRTRTRGAA